MEVEASEGNACTVALTTLGHDELFGNIRESKVRLAAPTCCIAVDAEEDFDWERPGNAVGYSTDCMRNVVNLDEVTSAFSLRPAYLLTYPVLEDAVVVRILRAQLERGKCEVGIQLHPWVTPPFDGMIAQASYLGALDPGFEESKLVNLIAAFRTAFGFEPTLFRAGRYGLSRATPRLLERHGILVDTSLAPRTDFSGQGGPDFSNYDCDPFWFGADRPLLEVPLCRALVGWAGRLAPALYQSAAAAPFARWRMQAVLSRMRCAERITLSPEGNDVRAMRRLLRARRVHGQSVFTLSFHSSSLAPGRNPYVRDRAELHWFYDRLSAILDAMARDGFVFSTLSALPRLLGGV